MSDHEYPGFDDQPERTERPESGRVRRRERKSMPDVSPQTAATVILVVVLVAILWVFFGPQGGEEAVPGLPTATATRVAAGGPTGSVVTATAGTPLAAPVATVEPGVATREASAGATRVPTALGTPDVTAVPAGPTPSQLSEGTFVRVEGTEEFGLRLRYGPGVDYITIRIVDEGETLRVTGGPERAAELSWWRLQDELGNIGWAAETYLRPVAAVPGWSPPAASPTFESSASDLAAPGGDGSGGAPSTGGTPAAP